MSASRISAVFVVSLAIYQSFVRISSKTASRTWDPKRLSGRGSEQFRRFQYGPEFRPVHRCLAGERIGRSHSLFRRREVQTFLITSLISPHHPHPELTTLPSLNRPSMLLLPLLHFPSPSTLANPPLIVSHPPPAPENTPPTTPPSYLPACLHPIHLSTEPPIPNQVPTETL
ncbi:hypothetical protein Salat_1107800 [Sesamum alatum]|uniref:Uncharacterized protein n=1 Tax=Sesamum alatum TaxID=300844 RepID=A0AAE1YN22_9LAMI|nr:hypothetical protein Salat_1107800 [Sesamum alatum]